MRTKLLTALAAVVLVSACTPQIASLGAVAIEKRRELNQMQARLTSAAMCDISIGAFFRDLNDVERELTARICGGSYPGMGVAPAVPRVAAGSAG